MKAGAHLFRASSSEKVTHVLVVGPSARFPAERDGIEGISFAAFRDVTADLLDRHGTTVVLSALWTEDFDVVDLACRLTHLGYGGRYRAVSGGVPNPEIIVSEVRRAFPCLDFRVLLYAGSGRLVGFEEYDLQP